MAIPGVEPMSHVARVTGGLGDDPKEIQPAVARALEQNAAGKLALIDVVLSDYLPRQ